MPSGFFTLGLLRCVGRTVIATTTDTRQSDTRQKFHNLKNVILTFDKNNLRSWSIFINKQFLRGGKVKMSKKYLLVELVSNLSSVINQPLQSTQRIKVIF